MSKAIHFGAGKIGRGFIGSVLNEAGYEVTFADVNQEIIDLINKEKGYAVHITGQNVYTKEIVGVSAIASGLNQRYRSCNTSPLNIICCENGIRATSTLKGYVMEMLDACVEKKLFTLNTGHCTTA